MLGGLLLSITLSFVISEMINLVSVGLTQTQRRAHSLIAQEGRNSGSEQEGYYDDITRAGAGRLMQKQHYIIIEAAINTASN